MSNLDIGDLEAIRLPEPMALSHSGGSGFRVGVVWECPRKAALKLLGWRVKFKKMPLAFGDIIHQHALGPYRREDKTAILPISTEMAVKEMIETETYKSKFTGLDQVERDVVQKLLPPTSDKDEKDRKSLPAVARMQMQVWNKRRYDPATVLDCEKLLVSGVVDPADRSVLPEMQAFKITARLDLRLDAGLDQAVKIRDLKTAKSAIKGWTTVIGYHRQLSTQRYVEASHNENVTDDIGCFQLTKHKTMESILKYAGEVLLTRPLPFRAIYEGFLGAARLLRKCEKERAWPKNPYACQGKFGACEFLEICWADQFDDPAEYKKTLQRKEDGNV